MYQYIITFRLEASASYQERYNDLMRNFKNYFENHFPDDTTSTLFANSWEHDINDVSGFISNQKLNKSDEILVLYSYDRKITAALKFTNGQIFKDTDIEGIFEINN